MLHESRAFILIKTWQQIFEQNHDRINKKYTEIIFNLDSAPTRPQADGLTANCRFSYLVQKVSICAQAAAELGHDPVMFWLLMSPTHRWKMFPSMCHPRLPTTHQSNWAPVHISVFASHSHTYVCCAIIYSSCGLIDSSNCWFVTVMHTWMFFLSFYIHVFEYLNTQQLTLAKIYKTNFVDFIYLSEYLSFHPILSGSVFVVPAVLKDFKKETLSFQQRSNVSIIRDNFDTD